MKKEFNKEEYNKLCAEFLGGIEYIPKPWYYFPRYQRHWFFPNRLEPNRFNSKMLKFDTDWNWIMEVKTKICTLNSIDEFNTCYDSVSNGFFCVISPSHNNTFNLFQTPILLTEKEAVVQAIWIFLNWYNEQK
jgi:hypothetical protein